MLIYAGTGYNIAYIFSIWFSPVLVVDFLSFYGRVHMSTSKSTWKWMFTGRYVMSWFFKFASGIFKCFRVQFRIVASSETNIDVNVNSIKMIELGLID